MFSGTVICELKISPSGRDDRVAHGRDGTGEWDATEPGMTDQAIFTSGKAHQSRQPQYNLWHGD